MTFKITFCYLIGSSGSKAGGAFPVFTEQNLQALVHVSPISIIVAVAEEQKMKIRRTLSFWASWPTSACLNSQGITFFLFFWSSSSF